MFRIIKRKQDERMVAIDPKISEPAPEQIKDFGRLGPLLRWLVEPDTSTPESTAGQGRLLPALILFLALGLGISFGVFFWGSGFLNPAQLIIPLVLILLLGLAYGLSRTKYHPWAAL